MAKTSAKPILYVGGAILVGLVLWGVGGTVSAVNNLKIVPTSLAFTRFSTALIINATMDFILRLEFRNPSSTPIEVEWMEIRISYEGKSLGTVRKDNAFTVPPQNQPLFVPVNLNIPVASFGQSVITQIMANRLPTHLDAEIDVKAQNAIVKLNQRIPIGTRTTGFTYINDGGSPALPAPELNIP